MLQMLQKNSAVTHKHSDSLVTLVRQYLRLFISMTLYQANKFK
jgi:hypothetical protein